VWGWRWEVREGGNERGRKGRRKRRQQEKKRVTRLKAKMRLESQTHKDS